MYVISTILKALSVMLNKYISMPLPPPMDIYRDASSSKGEQYSKPSAYVFDGFISHHCHLCPGKWTPIQAVHAAFHDYCKTLSPRPQQRPSYADIMNHLARHHLETKGTHNYYVVKGLEIVKWP